MIQELHHKWTTAVLGNMCKMKDYLRVPCKVHRELGWCGAIAARTWQMTKKMESKMMSPKLHQKGVALQRASLRNKDKDGRSQEDASKSASHGGNLVSRAFETRGASVRCAAKECQHNGMNCNATRVEYTTYNTPSVIRRKLLQKRRIHAVEYTCGCVTSASTWFTCIERRSMLWKLISVNKWYAAQGAIPCMVPPCIHTWYCMYTCNTCNTCSSVCMALHLQCTEFQSNLLQCHCASVGLMFPSPSLCLGARQCNVLQCICRGTL